MRKIISLIIRLSVSAAILFFLFRRVDLNKIAGIIYRANKPLLVLAIFLVLFIYFISFFRWKMLLGGLSFLLPNLLIFKSFCLGCFFNLFFPSTIGGDLMRSLDLGLRSHKPKQIVASVILDRLSGYAGLVIVALLALCFGYKIISQITVFFALGIIAVIFIGIITILFNNFLFSRFSRLLGCLGRIGEALSNLHFEVYNFRNQKRILINSVAYSLSIQIIMALSVYLISLALGTSIKLVYFFILVPIIAIVASLPISIAGLGLREASSMYFFTRVGMPAETALAVALLSFFALFLAALSAGIIYILTFQTKPRLSEQGEAKSSG